MKQRIHIFGASGSGTTTIAVRICDRLGHKHIDADDYFWLPTAEPFTVERPRHECLSLIREELLRYEKFVLSGSLSGWGEIFIPVFDLVVFVYVPQDIRRERLLKREYKRYGDRILQGGDKHEESSNFIDWAMAYDIGNRNGRSLRKHENLLKAIECSVLKIVNFDLEDSVNQVINSLA